KTYKPLEHQHIPEVVQTLADAGAKGVTLRFVPVSAPLSRGIFATCFAHVDVKVDAAAVKKLFAATDNLIKGGAGQAIQSMNLMLGLDERLTLEDPGSWP